MQKSIKVALICASLITVDVIAASWHIFNNSSYTLTVTPNHDRKVSVSPKKVTRDVVGPNSSSFIIESTPVKAKIAIGGTKGAHTIEYGKVDASGEFIGNTMKASIPAAHNGDPVLCIDVGMVSPKNKIAVEVKGMNDEYLSGYVRQ